MLATLYLERDPLRLADVPQGLVSWAQDAGGFCLVLLLVMMLWARTRWRAACRSGCGRRPIPGTRGSPARSLFLLCLTGAALGYAVVGLLRLPDLIASWSADAPVPGEAPKGTTFWVRYSDWALTFAACCALVAACLPFFAGFLSLRWRRIWGIARLSFKEAVRRKILYVFAAMLLVFLFLTGSCRPSARTSCKTTSPSSSGR